MKPLLVIGLGGPLMGDDGIGGHVAERLAADPRLPAGVDVICGGTDLLGCVGAIEGRERVVVIDAVLDGAEPGTVSPIEDGIEQGQEHAHHLSVTQAVALLGMTTTARFRLLGVSVAFAGAQPALSPALTARIPAILDRVLEELR